MTEVSVKISFSMSEAQMVMASVLTLIATLPEGSQEAEKLTVCGERIFDALKISEQAREAFNPGFH